MEERRGVGKRGGNGHADVLIEHDKKDPNCVIVWCDYLRRRI